MPYTMATCQTSNFRIVAKLLDAGANPDQYAALARAAAHQDVEVLRLLLDANADPDASMMLLGEVVTPLRRLEKNLGHLFGKPKQSKTIQDISTVNNYKSVAGLEKKIIITVFQGDNPSNMNTAYTQIDIYYAAISVSHISMKSAHTAVAVKAC